MTSRAQLIDQHLARLDAGSLASEAWVAQVAADPGLAEAAAREQARRAAISVAIASLPRPALTPELAARLRTISTAKRRSPIAMPQRESVGQWRRCCAVAAAAAIAVSALAIALGDMPNTAPAGRAIALAMRDDRPQQPIAVLDSTGDHPLRLTLARDGSLLTATVDVRAAPAGTGVPILEGIDGEGRVAWRASAIDGLRRDPAASAAAGTWTIILHGAHAPPRGIIGLRLAGPEAIGPSPAVALPHSEL